MKKKKISVRLSKDVVPVEYDIKLHPDLENFTFGGVETITLLLLKATKNLTLHSKEIDIETAHINLNNQKVFAKHTYNTKSETVTFTFPKSLPKGKAKLTINFKGILNDKMRGFYKSSYVYEGKVHNMATTQFEATDARRAFPCFDEPAQKAVFHVSLVIPKGKTAISNTLPVSKIEHEAGFEVVKFAPSPKMSTYLLAFIVGDFEYIEKKSKNGVLVRVYTIPGKVHQASFALDTTVKVLEFYEKYFDIPYPLNTLDMIAIPDFSSLAMENWGAITFREMGLLVDENNTSIGSKELIAEVIAHELAHQWFGNLVTMEWWTHLWLNEGFASYIPFLAIDELFPQWNIWERFTTSSHGTGVALKLDALANTHPIEIEVHHPDEIGEIFDEVSYSKGASVIRMLAVYLGEENFRDGLRHYLKKHSYKNTETLHLWEAFEKVSKKPVLKMMKVWTGKSGHPVIKTSQTRDGKLSLEQSRFFSSPASKKKVKDKTLWPIPVSVMTDSSNETILFSTKKTNLSIVGEWIKLNPEETGFYRTAYSKELLARLYAPVKNKTLSAPDRLGLVRDLFALSESGDIPTNDVLEFLSAYENEDNYIVWAEIALGIAKLNQLLFKTSAKKDLDKFVTKLFSPTFKRLGWDKTKDETHTDSYLRTLAISALGKAGNKEVLKEAKKRFELMRQGKKVDADLRSVIYSLVATHGGMKEYKIFTELYKKETLQEEKNRIGYALGDFREDKVLCEVVHFALSPNVRVQDTVSILSYVGMNPLGRNIWFKCLKQNWKILVDRYGQGGYTLARMLKAIGSTPEKKHYQEFKTFFKTHDAPGAKRSVEQVLERMESNILWLERDGKKIAKFLKDN